MSKIDDGGPASPFVTELGRPMPGMTLRDWFAGQVINAIIAGNKDVGFGADASDAYRQADAMLAARKEVSA